jgi:hypothetical protein
VSFREEGVVPFLCFVALPVIIAENSENLPPNLNRAFFSGTPKIEDCCPNKGT